MSRGRVTPRRARRCAERDQRPAARAQRPPERERRPVGRERRPQELLAAEAERKLALRHLEQAVHTYGVQVESFGAAVADLPLGSVSALLEEVAEHIKSGELPLSGGDRVVFRFQLDVMVALDVVDGPLEELTFWAFRTITGARRVAAMPQIAPTGLRGELARLRARRSWAAWDPEEVARELAPWPTSSP